MKNRLARVDPPARVKAARPRKPPKGRYARVWLSPEFLAWCQRHHFKPPGIAACVLHTEGLRSTKPVTIISYHGPVSVEDIYDLPGDQTQEGAALKASRCLHRKVRILVAQRAPDPGTACHQEPLPPAPKPLAVQSTQGGCLLVLVVVTALPGWSNPTGGKEE